MATQQQFRDFLSDIEPSRNYEVECQIPTHRAKGFLANDTEFKKLHVQTFLSGSYRRDTAIRPRKLGGVIARPDVDIIVETNHTLADDPKDVIDAVFYAIQRLKNQKESYTSLRRQARLDWRRNEHRGYGCSAHNCPRWHGWNSLHSQPET